MSTTIEQIRSILMPYISDTTGLVDIPKDLLSVLEDADDSAGRRAEAIEGVLGLYAVNKISRDRLRDRVRVLVDNTTVLTGPAWTLGREFYSSLSGASTMLLRVGERLANVVPASMQIGHGMESELPSSPQRETVHFSEGSAVRFVRGVSPDDRALGLQGSTSTPGY